MSSFLTAGAVAKLIDPQIGNCNTLTNEEKIVKDLAALCLDSSSSFDQKQQTQDQNPNPLASVYLAIEADDSQQLAELLKSVSLSTFKLNDESLSLAFTIEQCMIDALKRGKFNCVAVLREYFGSRLKLEEWEILAAALQSRSFLTVRYVMESWGIDWRKYYLSDVDFYPNRLSMFWRNLVGSQSVEIIELVLSKISRFALESALKDSKVKTTDLLRALFGHTGIFNKDFVNPVLTRYNPLDPCYMGALAFSHKANQFLAENFPKYFNELVIQLDPDSPIPSFAPISHLELATSTFFQKYIEQPLGHAFLASVLTGDISELLGVLWSRVHFISKQTPDITKLGSKSVSSETESNGIVFFSIYNAQNKLTHEAFRIDITQSHLTRYYLPAPAAAESKSTSTDSLAKRVALARYHACCTHGSRIKALAGQSFFATKVAFGGIVELSNYSKDAFKEGSKLPARISKALETNSNIINHNIFSWNM